MDVQRHLFLRRCFAYICCLLLCFITATTVYAQKVSVKGTVVDTNGDAIIGASVKVLKKVFRRYNYRLGWKFHFVCSRRCNKVGN